MFGKIELFQVATDMAKHASARQAKIAANIANADTPGYRAQDIKPFEATYQAPRNGGAMRSTRPGHDLSAVPGQLRFEAMHRNERVSPGGNDVTIETEMVEAVKTQKDHNRAVTVYQTALGILRMSVRGAR